LEIAHPATRDACSYYLMPVAIKDALLLVSIDNTTDSIASPLQDAGYQVSIAQSECRAIALLFLLRSFSAVVIDGREHERASFDLASRLHGIRAQIPIVVVGQKPAEFSTASADACITERELPETLRLLLKTPAHRLEGLSRDTLQHARA
jgi:hypothetical protein